MEKPHNRGGYAQGCRRVIEIDGEKPGFVGESFFSLPFAEFSILFPCIWRN
jgi:hypothetical protein